MPAESGPIQYSKGDMRTNIELLTTHAKVLLFIWENPNSSAVIMAARMGTSVRSIRQITRELRATDIIEVESLKEKR